MRRQDTDSKVRRRIDYLIVMTSIIATTSNWGWFFLFER
jgi:hypothetical protein